jgi:hypothetical protein
VSAQYASEEFKTHEDTIHNFKDACEERNVDYADAFLSGYMTAEEYHKVIPSFSAYLSTRGFSLWMVNVDIIC